MMSEQLCDIKICDIDLDDLRYRIPFSLDDVEFLAHSIRQTGLINPPLVRPVNNKFIIVSGFNRVRASIFNHEDIITAYKTDFKEDDYQCLVKSIIALSFQRQLTQAELIKCIKRLSNFLDAKQISLQSTAIFNMELSFRFVKNILDIANLPDPALELIHQGNISFKTAKKMLLFQKKTIMNFLTIFSNIKASNNKQLEIMQYMIDISKREAIKQEDFFLNQTIQKIILDPQKEPVLKTMLLREYLYQKRFPTLSKTRQTVQKKINNLKLGNKIKFLPPENFESQNYSISFTAKNYNEFQANTKILNTVLENRELKEIFEH